MGGVRGVLGFLVVQRQCVLRRCMDRARDKQDDEGSGVQERQSCGYCH